MRTLPYALLALALAGCSAAPAVVSGPVDGGAISYRTPGAGDDGPLTPDQTRTLSTLRVLDEAHPLFEMTYLGPLPQLVDAAEPVRFREPFGCTVFLAGDPARPMVGRNFDWDPNPALVLHTATSISFVDISYLGYDRARVKELDTPAGRRALLRAPMLPFDGMNEHGLMVGMAAEESAVAVKRPGRQVTGSVRIMRLVLERSRTVAEAIRVLDDFDLDFTGGPPLHYFVADPTGASAIVEFVGGRFTVIPRGPQPWQVMVNFQQATSTAASRQADRRWSTATARLSAARGALDPARTLALLADVRQGHTQWSAAYDLKARTVSLVVGQRYGTVREFRV